MSFLSNNSIAEKSHSMISHVYRDRRKSFSRALQEILRNVSQDPLVRQLLQDRTSSPFVTKRLEELIGKMLSDHREEYIELLLRKIQKYENYFDEENAELLKVLGDKMVEVTGIQADEATSRLKYISALCEQIRSLQNQLGVARVTNYGQSPTRKIKINSIKTNEPINSPYYMHIFAEIDATELDMKLKLIQTDIVTLTKLVNSLKILHQTNLIEAKRSIMDVVRLFKFRADKAEQQISLEHGKLAELTRKYEDKMIPDIIANNESREVALKDNLTKTQKELERVKKELHEKNILLKTLKKQQKQMYVVCEELKLQNSRIRDELTELRVSSLEKDDKLSSSSMTADSLSRQLNQARQENDKMQQVLTKAKTKLNHLKERADTAEKSYSDQVVENSDLKRQVLDLVARFESSQQKMLELSRINKEIVRQLKEKTEEQDEATSELSSIEEEYSHIKKSLSEHKTLVKSLNIQLEHSNQQVQEQQDLISEMQNTIKNLEHVKSANSKLKISIDALNRQLQNMYTKIDDDEKLKSNTERSLKEINKLLLDEKENTQRLTDEIAMIKKELSDTKSNYKKVEWELKMERDKNNSLENEKYDLEDANKNVAQSADRIRSQQIEDRKKYEQQNILIKELEIEKDDLEARLKNSEELIHKQLATISDLKQKLVKSGNERLQAESDKADIEAELQRFKKLGELSKREAESALIQSSNLSDAYEQKQQELHQKELLIDKLSRQLQTFSLHNENIRNELQQALDDLEKVSTELDISNKNGLSLKNQLGKVNEEKAAMLQELNDVKQAHDLVTTKLDHANQEIENKIKIHNEMENHIHSIKDQLVSKDKEIFNMKNENDELSKYLNELKEEAVIVKEKYESTIDDLRNTITQKTSASDKTSRLVDQLNDEKNELNSKLKALSNEYHKVKADMTEASKDTDNLRDEIQNLSISAKQKQKNIDEQKNVIDTISDLVGGNTYDEIINNAKECADANKICNELCSIVFTNPNQLKIVAQRLQSEHVALCAKLQLPNSSPTGDIIAKLDSVFSEHELDSKDLDSLKNALSNIIQSANSRHVPSRPVSEGLEASPHRTFNVYSHIPFPQTEEERENLTKEICDSLVQGRRDRGCIESIVRTACERGYDGNNGEEACKYILESHIRELEAKFQSEMNEIKKTMTDEKEDLTRRYTFDMEQVKSLLSREKEESLNNLNKEKESRSRHEEEKNSVYAVLGALDIHEAIDKINQLLKDSGTLKQTASIVGVKDEDVVGRCGILVSHSRAMDSIVKTLDVENPDKAVARVIRIHNDNIKIVDTLGLKNDEKISFDVTELYDNYQTSLSSCNALKNQLVGVISAATGREQTWEKLSRPGNIDAIINEIHENMKVYLENQDVVNTILNESRKYGYKGTLADEAARVMRDEAVNVLRLKCDSEIEKSKKIYEQTICQLRNNINGLHSSKKQLEDALQNTQSCSTSNIDSLSAQLYNLNSQLNDAKNENRELSYEIERLNNENNDLKENNIKLNKNVANQAEVLERVVDTLGISDPESIVQSIQNMVKSDNTLRKINEIVLGNNKSDILDVITNLEKLRESVCNTIDEPITTDVSSLMNGLENFSKDKDTYEHDLYEARNFISRTLQIIGCSSTVQTPVRFTTPNRTSKHLSWQNNKVIPEDREQFFADLTDMIAKSRTDKDMVESILDKALDLGYQGDDCVEASDYITKVRLDEKTRQYENDIEQIKAKLSRENEDLKKTLNVTIDKSDSSMNELHNVIKSLTYDKQKLEKDVKDLELDKNNMQAVINSLESNVEDYKKDVVSKSNQIRQLTMKLDKLNDEVESASMSSDKNSKKVSELNKEIEELKVILRREEEDHHEREQERDKILAVLGSRNVDDALMRANSLLKESGLLKQSATILGVPVDDILNKTSEYKDLSRAMENIIESIGSESADKAVAQVKHLINDKKRIVNSLGIENADNIPQDVALLVEQANNDRIRLESILSKASNVGYAGDNIMDAIDFISNERVEETQKKSNNLIEKIKEDYEKILDELNNKIVEQQNIISGRERDKEVSEKSLKSNIDELTRKLESVLEQKAESDLQIEELSSKYKSANDKIVELDSVLNKQSTEIKKYVSDLNAVKEESREMESELSSTKEQLMDSKIKLRNANNDIQRISDILCCEESESLIDLVNGYSECIGNIKNALGVKNINEVEDAFKERNNAIEEISKIVGIRMDTSDLSKIKDVVANVSKQKSSLTQIGRLYGMTDPEDIAQEACEQNELVSRLSDMVGSNNYNKMFEAVSKQVSSLEQIGKITGSKVPEDVVMDIKKMSNDLNDAVANLNNLKYEHDISTSKLDKIEQQLLLSNSTLENKNDQLHQIYNITGAKTPDELFNTVRCSNKISSQVSRLLNLKNPDEVIEQIQEQSKIMNCLRDTFNSKENDKILKEFEKQNDTLDVIGKMFNNKCLADLPEEIKQLKVDHGKISNDLLNAHSQSEAQKEVIMKTEQSLNKVLTEKNELEDQVKKIGAVVGQQKFDNIINSVKAHNECINQLGKLFRTRSPDELLNTISSQNQRIDKISKIFNVDNMDDVIEKAAKAQNLIREASGSYDTSNPEEIASRLKEEHDAIERLGEIVKVKGSDKIVRAVIDNMECIENIAKITGTNDANPESVSLSVRRLDSDYNKLASEFSSAKGEMKESTQYIQSLNDELQDRENCIKKVAKELGLDINDVSSSEQQEKLFENIKNMNTTLDAITKAYSIDGTEKMVEKVLNQNECIKSIGEITGIDDPQQIVEKVKSQNECMKSIREITGSKNDKETTRLVKLISEDNKRVSAKNASMEESLDEKNDQLEQIGRIFGLLQSDYKKTYDTAKKYYNALMTLSNVYSINDLDNLTDTIIEEHATLSKIGELCGKNDLLDILTCVGEYTVCNEQLKKMFGEDTPPEGLVSSISKQNNFVKQLFEVLNVKDYDSCFEIIRSLYNVKDILEILCKMLNCDESKLIGNIDLWQRDLLQIKSILKISTENQNMLSDTIAQMSLEKQQNQEELDGYRLFIVRIINAFIPNNRQIKFPIDTNTQDRIAQVIEKNCKIANNDRAAIVSLLERAKREGYNGSTLDEAVTAIAKSYSKIECQAILDSVKDEMDSMKKMLDQEVSKRNQAEQAYKEKIEKNLQKTVENNLKTHQKDLRHSDEINNLQQTIRDLEAKLRTERLLREELVRIGNGKTGDIKLLKEKLSEQEYNMIQKFYDIVSIHRKGEFY